MVNCIKPEVKEIQIWNNIMRKIFIALLILAFHPCFVAFSQTHTATYGDEHYMECRDKGYYTHCWVKHDLDDGKWVFFYPGTNNLAVVANVKDEKWNGCYFTYREDGTLSALSIYKDDLEREFWGYYPNGQIHFRAFSPNGEFFAIDSLGTVIRHEKNSEASSFRKAFDSLKIIEIMTAFNIQDSFQMLYNKDSSFCCIHHSIQNTSIYEIRKLEGIEISHLDLQCSIPLIGVNREMLLSDLGTDFYMMTESFVDYSLDSAGMAQLSIKHIPNYLLRCCFEDDIVHKMFIVLKNEKLSFQDISLFLNNLSKEKQNH